MKRFEKVLKNGDEGELVLDLQQRLIDLHFDRCKFDDGSIGEVEANGIFGDVTQEALKDFQQKIIDTIDTANIDAIMEVKNQHQSEVILGEFDYYTWYVLSFFEDLCSTYKLTVIPNDIGLEAEIIETEAEELVSKEQIKFIFKCQDYIVNQHYEALNKTLRDYNINTPLRICHFLAQIGQESMGLKYLEEIASGSAYEGRQDLGNIYPGDGKLFKGRCPLQLTGRDNYTAYFASIGKPELIHAPERVATDMELMWGAAGWFWKTRNLNYWCDRDNINEVTRRVNGGYNGLSGRKYYLNRAKQVIK